MRSPSPWLATAAPSVDVVKHAARRPLGLHLGAFAGDLAGEPVDFDRIRRQRPLWKAAGPGETVDLEIQVPIAKIDAEQRTVTGVVLEPTDVTGADTQNDVYTAEAVEGAQESFMDSQKLRLQHQTDLSRDQVRLKESWIQREDTYLGGQRVVKGTWLITVKVLDDLLWQSVKNGSITGFSIGGTATRTPLAPTR